MMQITDFKKLPRFKFKRDEYMRKRGTPAMLFISCRGCMTYIMCYQKDGKGPLKRCYLDRIHHPPEIEKFEKEHLFKQSCPNLICPSCKAIVGTPALYEKEERLAFIISPGSIFYRKIPSQKR